MSYIEVEDPQQWSGEMRGQWSGQSIYAKSF
ncbi:unnamed protein product [Fusarium venenatum]|uniref:Uncharacterized protein n=1 Tax=Fusarium venenatum TaxID=56646 RepID=A0A2L2SVG4_9HYPO|nr:uncharacterized protein FVRRES_12396 [Fusarium venenatum]CEI39705.1 unnamed protein product [Fusarium venenatum]